MLNQFIMFQLRCLLPIILFFSIFISCSSDNDDDMNEQDFTSFVVTIDATPIFPNCVAAYKKDGKYHKLGDLGDLTKGKYSPEIRVNDNSITSIYIFSDYNGIIRFDDTYNITKNIKNNITIANGTKGIGISDKSDPTQYPQ